MDKTKVPPAILECHLQCVQSIEQFPPKLMVRDLVGIKESDSFGCVVGLSSDEDHGDNWSYLVLLIDDSEPPTECQWFDFEQLEKIEPLRMVDMVPESNGLLGVAYAI